MLYRVSVPLSHRLGAVGPVWVGLSVAASDVVSGGCAIESHVERVGHAYCRIEGRCGGVEHGLEGLGGVKRGDEGGLGGVKRGDERGLGGVKRSQGQRPRASTTNARSRGQRPRSAVWLVGVVWIRGRWVG